MSPSTSRIEVDWLKALVSLASSHLGHNVATVRTIWFQLVQTAALLSLLLSAIHSVSELGVLTDCVPNIVELTHLGSCGWLEDAKKLVE